MKFPIPCSLALLSLTFAQSLVAAEPEILKDAPISDAGRGLVRASAKEIRHYGGNASQGGVLPYMYTKNEGKTWKTGKAGSKFPKKWGGIAKEAAATVYLPKSKKYMMIQPIRGYIFIADELDGEWLSPAADGKKFIKSDEWMSNQSSLYKVPNGQIFRNPYELASGRIIIPMHNSAKGTTFLISDDKGLTWKSSKDSIFIPAFREKGIDLAGRWRNAGVEGTVVQLKNGKLYAVVRTDSNMSYESISRNEGESWSKPVPSPFYGSLVMTTLGRLNNGKLISLWTNTAPMPELAHGGGTTWEDVFTGRGAMHVALSNNEGKTWYGYREVIIDPLRDSESFATSSGDHDRSSHQAEFLELDKNRILISCGQHPSHRKFVIIDQAWVNESSRIEDIAKNGLKNITSHVFIPKIHKVQYNRKAGAVLSGFDSPSKKSALKFGIINDDSLINEPLKADYRRSGVTWNFPVADLGELSFNVHFPAGSPGCHVSLTDRMFNPGDSSVDKRAVFSFKIGPDDKLGKLRFKPDQTYRIKLRFKGSKCAVYVNKYKKAIKSFNAINKTDVGISYLHFIAGKDGNLAGNGKMKGAVPFFQSREDGKTLEKTVIVNDFKMRGKRKKK